MLVEGVDVTKAFGGLVALKDVDFRLGVKEIVALVGPNGSGKTTLFNCISGIYPATSGVIKFDGKEITHMPVDQITRLGIGRTFQLVRPFLNMTALQNVMISVLFCAEKSLGMNEGRQKALEYLEFVGLQDKKDILARNCTLIDRKFLEVARALAVNPKVLLMDEVIAGLNATETEQAMRLIGRIRDEFGITIFWIEHVMRAVMGAADRIVVLHHGMKIAEGTPEDISKDQNVIDAYLGKQYVS